MTNHWAPAGILFLNYPKKEQLCQTIHRTAVAVTGNRVNVNEDYELRHLADKMGVSADEVKAAVKAVGDRREKVEEYLRGNKGRQR